MSAAGEKLSGELEKILLKRISTGRLALPAMAAAGHCLELLRDQDLKVPKVVEKLETEPMLALRVLADAISTSPAGSAAFTTLAASVSRLGPQRLRTLLAEYNQEEQARSSDRKLLEANQRLWEHSVAVAILARDIAALINNPDPDGCYLAGLLHDIGKPLVSTTLLDIDRKTRASQKWLDVAIWQEVVDAVHRTVGVALATEWKLPLDVVDAVRDCNDYDNSNRARTANVVRLANAVAKREGFGTGTTEAADVEAMIMVGTSMLGADTTLLQRLASTVRQRFPAGTH